MSKEYQDFQAFYAFYLSEHSNKINRLLHFIGSCLCVLILLDAIFFGRLWEIILLPIVGYGFAWVGHFFFEKNTPATFKYPLYSFFGDWKMFYDVLRGQVKIF